MRLSSLMAKVPLMLMWLLLDEQMYAVDGSSGGGVNDMKPVKSEWTQGRRLYTNYSIVLVQLTEESQWDMIEALEMGAIRGIHAEVLRKRRRLKAGTGQPIRRETNQKPLGEVELLVGPDHIDKLSTLLSQEEVKLHVNLDDLERVISEEKEQLMQRKIFGPSSHSLNFTTAEYHRFEEIKLYIKSVARAYPEMVTLLGPIGYSSEGRELLVVKIGFPSESKKPGVFINGCMHAREWVACASLLHIIHQLTANVNASSGTRELLEAIDVYVMPVVNPDGYEYSWNEDRLWRKTRSGPTPGTQGACYGVDANRNFDFDFGNGEGAADPCGNTYPGPHAFSEPETRAVAQFLNELRQNLSVYLDVHAYSEKLIYPYGNSSIKRAWPNEEEIICLINNATRAINAVNGERYQAGSVMEVMYHASGLAIDYAMGHLGIPYSFAVELRPDAGASNGFILPSTEIPLAAEEVWAGMRVIFEWVIREHESKNAQNEERRSGNVIRRENEEIASSHSAYWPNLILLTTLSLGFSLLTLLQTSVLSSIS